MKKRVSFIAGLLLLALLLGSLAACKTGGGDPTSAATGTPGTDDGETTTAAPVTPREPVDEVVILSEGKSNYFIVRSETATKWELEAAKTFQTCFKALTGVMLPMVEDYEGPDSDYARQPKEIVFGRTNRENEYEVDASAIRTGYRIFTDYERLVFVAGGESAMWAALRSFFLNQFDVDLDEGMPAAGNAKNLILPNDYEMIVKFTSLELPYMKTELSKYQIAYPVSGADPLAPRLAHVIATAVKEVSGKTLTTVATDKPAEASFVLRETLPDGTALGPGKFAVRVSGKTVYLCAPDYNGVTALGEYLKGLWQHGCFPFGSSAYTGTDGDFRTTLSSLSSSSAYAYDRQGNARVMFYNVLWGNSAGENQFPAADRNLLQIEMIRQYLPDVLGCQEFNKSKREQAGEKDLVKLLAAEGYKEAVDPNVSLTQELQYITGATKTVTHYGTICTPIFYRESTTNLLESGYLWYVHQSHKDNNGNAGPNGPGAMDQSSKAMSWAVFENKSNGAVYAVVSTHLCTQIDEVRGQQAEEALALIATIVSKHNCPVFIGGDFNSQESGAGYRTLMGAEGMVDARHDAPITTTTRSHHPYPNLNTATGLILPTAGASVAVDGNNIDHILLLNGGNAELRLFGCVVDEMTLSGSDHFPVFADVILTASTGSEEEWIGPY